MYLPGAWLKKRIVWSPLEGFVRKAHMLGVELDAVKNAAYDEETFAVMRRCLRADSTCVDVGCHHGSVLEEMIRVAPAGKHYAFEPIPYMYEELRTNFPQVNVFSTALSDASGDTTFQHVKSSPGYSGLRRHVVVLARFAVLHVEASQAACRRGLSEARSDLRDVASLAVVEAAVQTSLERMRG